MAPVATVPPGELGHLRDVAVAAHEHDRGEVLVGVAHRHRPSRAGPARSASRLVRTHASGESQVTSTCAGEVRLGLRLVAGVQDEVEGEAP